MAEASSATTMDWTSLRSSGNRLGLILRKNMTRTRQGLERANHNIKQFTSMEKIDTGIHIGRAGSEEGANSPQEAKEESDDEAATNDYKQVKTWLAGHPDAGVRDADCRSSVADVSVVSIVSVVAVVAVLQIHHLPLASANCSKCSGCSGKL